MFLTGESRLVRTVMLLEVVVVESLRVTLLEFWACGRGLSLLLRLFRGSNRKISCLRRAGSNKPADCTLLFHSPLSC
jgi:hypothetical protein